MAGLTRLTCRHCISCVRKYSDIPVEADNDGGGVDYECARTYRTVGKKWSLWRDAPMWCPRRV